MQAANGTAGVSEHFTAAAQAIAAAVVLDGLDGRIARMTNTTSAFGREMDSLADVISFGLAPAVLAFAWGVQFIEPIIGVKVRGQIFNAGYFIAFLFLLCGACRLARFNVQVNPDPQESRPPRPQVFRRTSHSRPPPPWCPRWFGPAMPSRLRWWPLCVLWLGLLALLGFLMVSTWRYYSFKGISMSKAYSPLIIILVGAFIYGLWNYAQLLFLAMSTAYVASGIVIRIGGIVRRRLRHAPRNPEIKIA